MQKILTVDKIREADRFTIENEPISSIDLMERAANEMAKEIEAHFEKKTVFTIICGPGNNGGDGLALGRLLYNRGYDCHVFLWKGKSQSDDNITNENRLIKDLKIPVHIINDASDIPSFESCDIIIDAIFGSGLTRSVNEGLPADIINKINQSNKPILSIDMPSGLFADQSHQHKKDLIIKADIIYTLQFPKLSLLLPENADYIKNWKIIPIGLHPEFIKSVETDMYLLEKRDIGQLIFTRQKFSHKGTYGHGLLIAGSKGKMGAAILSGKACMKTGIGLLTAHIPNRGEVMVQSTVPEIMVDLDEHADYFTGLKYMNNYSAIGVGPGIGKNKATANALKLLIQNHRNTPFVIDADAINILSENKTWLSFLPKNTILTPHPKEFERIAGKSNTDIERLNLQKEMSIKYQIIIILKGAYTSISDPNGNIFFNNTGNSGMATAGSGDVLTGIILSLLAQGYSPIQASFLGVWIHGEAGDFASNVLGEVSMTAEDIINHIFKTFSLFLVKK